MKDIISKFRKRGMIGVSSKYLVKKIIDKIDFENDLQIIQLGVGTGVFTKEILKKMSKNSKLFAFEVDKSCKKYIEKIGKDNRLIYIEDSAENMDKYIKVEVDYIVSTLPFASLSKELLDKIVWKSKIKLKENAVFLQYQYFLTDKKKIETIFERKSKLDFEIRNFPPAFIYKIDK